MMLESDQPRTERLCVHQSKTKSLTKSALFSRQSSRMAHKSREATRQLTRTKTDYSVRLSPLSNHPLVRMSKKVTNIQKT